MKTLCQINLGLRVKCTRLRASSICSSTVSVCLRVSPAFRVQGLGFRVQGSKLRIQGSGFEIEVVGFRVQGIGLVQGYRIEVGF